MSEAPETREEAPRAVLLQTSIPTAEALVRRFLAHEVDADLVDRPSTLAVLLAFGTYRVRIGVPPDQIERARRLLSEWEPETRANVKELAGKVYRQMALAAIPAVAVFLVNQWSAGEFRFLAVCAALVVGFLGFMALAFFERFRAGG